MSQGPAELADLGLLAELAPELASTFVSVASDIALVIGPDGVIRNVAQGDAPLISGATQWVGRAFADTVSLDTRGKITQMLLDAGANGVSRRREVNLTSAEGSEIPVAFAAIRLGRDGPVLAVGRDLRAIAAIQQRFVEAQQEMERDYWKQRHAESRYRLLFQVANDAVMVVDAQKLVIIEANGAAAQMFGGTPEQLANQPATAGIDAASRPAVDELLRTARGTGKPAEIRARLRAAPGVLPPAPVDISATPFRAGNDGATQHLLLVRARRGESRSGDGLRQLAEFVEHTPDAVVITDSIGRLQMANPAFLQLCGQADSEHDLKGRTLPDLLGDPSRRLEALITEVRRNGIASQVRAPLGRNPTGEVVEVEVSAALLDEGDQECIGFTLRRHSRRFDGVLRPVDGLVNAIESLVNQLGRVSLPELMQEATHLAERHLLRSALSRAQGNAGQAAEWLGVTPESLALRLQRHGLSDDASGPPKLLN